MPKQTFFNLPAAKRDRIIDVAITEFLENDFQAASISRICAQAGIAKGSFYQYFTGKEDLYLHLFDLMAQSKRDFLSGDMPDPQLGVFAYLRDLTRKGVEFELAHPRLSDLGYRAVSSGSLPAGFEAQMQQDTLAFFRQLVALGKGQGQIAAHIDEDLAAFLLNTVFSELGRYLMDRAGGGAARPDPAQPFFDRPEVRALLDQTYAIMEHGLSGSADRPDGPEGQTQDRS